MFHIFLRIATENTRHCLISPRQNHRFRTLPHSRLMTVATAIPLHPSGVLKARVILRTMFMTHTTVALMSERLMRWPARRTACVFISR